MEEHKHSRLKDSQKYTFIFIGIGMTFVCASILVLFDKGTDMKDLYAAFSGIIGGLIGGLVTLEGVRRTVYSQVKIESQKLIPTKLLHLYKLKKELKFFKDIKDNVNRWGSNFSYYTPTDDDDKSLEAFTQLFKMIKDYRGIREFAESPLDNKEYQFIEIVSEIDVELYYKVVQIFESVNNEIKRLDEALQSVNFNIYFPDQKEAQNAVTLYNKFVAFEDRNGIETFYGTTFIKYMNSSNTTPGQIVNTIRKATPRLQAIYNCLDKGINELNSIMEEKEREFKGKKKKIL